MTDQAIHEILGLPYDILDLPINNTNIVENVTEDYASKINEGFWIAYNYDMGFYKFVAEKTKWLIENLPQVSVDAIVIFFKLVQKTSTFLWHSLIKAVESLGILLVDKLVYFLMQLYIGLRLIEEYLKTVMIPALERAKHAIINSFVTSIGALFGKGLAVVDTCYEILQYAFKNSIGLILPALPPLVRGVLTVGVVSFGIYQIHKFIRKATNFALDTYKKPLKGRGNFAAMLTMFLNYIPLMVVAKFMDQHYAVLDETVITSMIVTLAMLPFSIYSGMRIYATCLERQKARDAEVNKASPKKPPSKNMNQNKNAKSITHSFEKNRNPLSSKNAKVKKESLKKVTRKALPRHH